MTMKQIVPDYYKQFQCIAGKCRHNCCIGWEIDIDEDTAAYYRTVSGTMGTRLQSEIDWKEQPCFQLGEEERCPFLNENNLCDIILNLGEEHICEICTEHPRFHNDMGDRIESGLGLCCEEAGRLILGWQGKVILEESSERNTEEGDPDLEEMIELRDEAIRILQNRGQKMSERVQRMRKFCGVETYCTGRKNMVQWTGFLKGLERLDERWTQVLDFVAENAESADVTGFDRHMKDRQTEYEQLVVYLLFRHMINAFDEVDLAARAEFAVWGYEWIHMAGAAVWTVTGQFSFEDQVELVRLFSSEIEYSEENLDAVLDEMVA